MITHFNNHWDKVPRTKYPKRFIDPEVVKNITSSKTIFVKIDQNSQKIEQVWEGKVERFETVGNNILFDVIIERTIEDFTSFSIEIKQPYWRRIDTSVQDSTFYLRPPFFDNLLITRDWKRFEDEAFLLLKLLGLNTVFQFTKQRGEADGFFKLGTLAVLYDTTLEDAFESKKQKQIENFCAQMKQGSIVINGQKNTQTFHEVHKQVWIITRGISRVIGNIDSIIVKEVTVLDLIKLYDERLDFSMTSERFENGLRLIGEN
jgi:hypothetical protein